LAVSRRPMGRYRVSCSPLSSLPALSLPSRLHHHPPRPRLRGRQVTSDDKHTIHVWRWMPHSNKYVNAHYIPGWCLGPEKKIRPLRAAQRNSPAEGGSGVGGERRPGWVRRWVGV
jgi:hypothetical protein